MSLALLPAARPGIPARIGAGMAAALGAQHGRFGPWLAVALGIGVLCYFSLSEEPTSRVLWLALPLAALGFWLARRWLVLGWALGMLAAGLLGFGAAAWHAQRMPPPLALPFTAVVLSGQVAEVEPLPEGRRVTLEQVRIEGGAPLARRIRLRLRRDDPALPQPGDRLTIRALLREPGAPVVPGGWDFQRAAYFSGLGGSGFALGPASLEPGEGAALARLRARLDRDVAAAIPGPAGPVAAALLSGTQTAIPPDVMAAMRDSGLAHLLSVSGLHMAIVMGLVFGALRLGLALIPWVALRVPGKPVAALAALGAGLFYMLLTGSQVPMQRCLGMAALMTLALLAGRRALSLRVIAIAAAGVMLAAPAELLGPSFQMSFAAVLALIAGHEALRAPLAAFRLGGGWGRRVVLLGFGLVLTSVLAGAATTPYGLHHFGRLQIYGVVANAVAVPLTSLWVMPAGVLAMVALPLGLSDVPLMVMGWGVEGIIWVAAQVASWPEAAPSVAPLPGWGLALASFGFCWLCLWRGWPRALGVPVMLAGLAGGWVSPPPDVLVSADARLVALRTAEGVFLQRLPGASNFTRDGMLRAMGVASAQPLPEHGGALDCTPAACRLGGLVLLRQPPAPRGRRNPPADPGAFCGQAALILALEPVRPRCAAGVTIDRFAMWRDGAQAIWLGTGTPRVETDRGWRGARPWVPPVPLPGRAEALPQAPLDSGGQ